MASLDRSPGARAPSSLRPAHARRPWILAILLALAVVVDAPPPALAGPAAKVKRPAAQQARRPAQPRAAELARDVYQTPVPGRRRPGMTLREKFGGVYLAGFESSSQQMVKGQPNLNMLRTTQHERLVRQDYRRLRQAGIRAARETASWDVIDRGQGVYDFRTLDRFIAAGKEFGITQIWDLWHYGYPTDADPFSDAFVARFAAYAGATARRLKPHLAPGQIAYFTPVNEINFFSWAAGQNGDFAPFARGRGDDLKRQLVRAWIAGAEAIWKEIPDAQMVTAEPVTVIHPSPTATPAERARRLREHKRADRAVFDMLSGRRAPELGGSPRHLGIVGINYYPHLMQKLDGVGTLKPEDPRLQPFADVLMEIRDAYPGHQVLVTETMRDGDAAGARWIRELTEIKKELATRGADDLGFTLYPILRMPEWSNLSYWHKTGLWDLQKDSSRTVDGEPRRKRVVRKAMYDALQASIAEIDPANATEQSRRIDRPAGRRSRPATPATSAPAR